MSSLHGKCYCYDIVYVDVVVAWKMLLLQYCVSVDVVVAWTMLLLQYSASVDVIDAAVVSYVAQVQVRSV